MTRSFVPKLSVSQRTELWERWRKGETIAGIGRALGVNPGGIFQTLAITGGIPPPTRYRSPRSLSLAEREQISRGIAEGESARSIATRLGRACSTITREINRNGGREVYSCIDADRAAWTRAKRPKLCKLAQNGRLRPVVARKLALLWSPEQIAGWLKKQFPEDSSMHVSHETIYCSLFVQTRGVLKKELIKCLRSRRKIRRSKHATRKGTRGHIIDAVPISERPREVEDRSVPGHWEGDLLAGSKKSYIITLNERQSRFTLLGKIESKETAVVVATLKRMIKRLPGELRQSLTWDRGLEMAQHKVLKAATDIEIFFCDPYSPWQRGTNENTNGLLRQYLPKGTDISIHSQAELNKIARSLNQRPRKTLDFQTPADVLSVSVASIS